MAFTNPAWVDPIEATFDEGKPVRSGQGLLLAGNPIAIAQGATGAPVMVTGWHPYDMVNVGDGNDGLIYDNSVDGNVTTVYSPNFSDGYQYCIYSTDLEITFNTNLSISAEMSDGSFKFLQTVSANTSGDPINLFVFSFEFPRLLRGAYSDNTQYSGSKVKDVRFRAQASSSQNITAGKLYMLRRREYVTG